MHQGNNRHVEMVGEKSDIPLTFQNQKKPEKPANCTIVRPVSGNFADRRLLQEPD